MIYNSIVANNHKQFILLIDPDKHSKISLTSVINNANEAEVDFFFIGGSLISSSIDSVIDLVRTLSSIPVILFPGSLLQISEKADAILYLSLISGRNPDLLIGNQVIAAPFLKKSGLEVISTGYMLVESGNVTSVEYISNTRPIPSEKIDLAVATAVAGDMIGFKLIYIDAGSGANQTVSYEMISEIKKNISIPLIVGGGIKSHNELDSICKAGADLVVVSTAIEKDQSLLKEFSAIVHQY